MSRITLQRSHAGNAYDSGSRWTAWHRWLFAVFLLVTLGSSNAQDQQWFEFGATMNLSPIAPDEVLNPDAIAMWEALTASFYVDALLAQTNLSPAISDPQVTVILTVAARPTSDTTGLTLAMQYTATASFVSDSTAYDPSLLALPAFQDQTAVLQYVVTLRESGHTVFESLTTLSLNANASVPISAPTAAPTRVATTAPTKIATGTPTLAPTLSVTSADTPEPTVDTTAFPTMKRPSFSLTAPPVLPATPAPTDFPTNADSEFDPGPEPDIGGQVVDPTGSPTSSPVMVAPTQNTNLQAKFATTALVFHYVPSRMSDIVQNDWERVTISYLKNYIQNLDDSLLQQNNSIRIERVIQEESRLRRRRLQTNSTISLSIEFVSKLELPPEVDANSLVNGAFTTKSRRDAYQATIKKDLQLLVDSGDASEQSVLFFAALEQIGYVTDSSAGDATDDSPSQLITTDDQGEGAPVGPIVGGAVGGLAIILIIASLVLRSKSTKGGSKDMTSSDGGINSDNANNTKELSPTGTGNCTTRTAAGLTWEPAEQPSRLNQEILVQDSNYDDVSTIGDPFVYGQPPSIPDDDRTATTSVLQTDTYNSLLGRNRIQHEQSFTPSHGDDTDFSAFTGMSKYMTNNVNQPPLLNPQQPHSLRTRGLLGELGLDETDDTSFEQRLFPMDKEEEHEQYTVGEERSLDYSLPTALM